MLWRGGSGEEDADFVFSMMTTITDALRKKPKKKKKKPPAFVSNFLSVL
jgi:hypothetical protein